MINGYEVLQERYPECTEEQRTPNGIDLKLGQVYEISSGGYYCGILKSGKSTPLLKPLGVRSLNDTNGDLVTIWELYPKIPYILEVDEQIQIDKDSMQTYYPRSTLLRCGCTLHTAVGDAGYNGKLSFLFINHSENPFVIEPGARFAQLVDHQVKGASIQYDGDYQNDKHKEGV